MDIREEIEYHITYQFVKILPAHITLVFLSPIIIRDYYYYCDIMIIVLVMMIILRDMLQAHLTSHNIL